MAEFINTIDVLGDDAVMDSIIDRSITEFKDNMITEVGRYAFSNCTSLVLVDLPEVTRIHPYSFPGCNALDTLRIPKAKPALQSWESAFDFRGLSSLHTLELSDAVDWKYSNMFNGCADLETLSLPNTTIFGQASCRGCTSLNTVYAPKVHTINNTAFYSCSSLTMLDLPSLTAINGFDQFNSCTSLRALVLRNTDAVCTLNISRTFKDTPIENGTGYIYVPRALVDSYKAATNWSTYADQIRAVEDYTVDGTISGDMNKTKI